MFDPTPIANACVRRHQSRPWERASADSSPSGRARLPQSLPAAEARQGGTELAVWADRVSVEALDFEVDLRVLELALSDDLADAVGDQLSLKKLQDLLAAQTLHDVEIAPGFAPCRLGHRT